jgi:hypothetical protein
VPLDPDGRDEVLEEAGRGAPGREVEDEVDVREVLVEDVGRAPVPEAGREVGRVELEPLPVVFFAVPEEPAGRDVPVRVDEDGRVSDGFELVVGFLVGALLGASPAGLPSVLGCSGVTFNSSAIGHPRYARWAGVTRAAANTNGRAQVTAPKRQNILF